VFKDRPTIECMLSAGFLVYATLLGNRLNIDKLSSAALLSDTEVLSMLFAKFRICIKDSVKVVYVIMYDEEAVNPIFKRHT